MITNVPKILITDSWTRKSLSAVRSLGVEGLEVHAVSHKVLAPAIYSRYVKKFYIAPDPSKRPQPYVAEILGLLKKEKFDALFPFEEASIAAFLEARTEIERLTALPLARAEAFETAQNKWKVLQLAAELGVPTPRSFLPASRTEAEEAIDRLGFPFVVKPTNESGSRGFKKIHDKREFEQYYPQISRRYGSPILQEYIDQSGQGVGVAVLAKRGKTLVSFSYKRLREFPVQGGPSTLRESTDDPILKGWAARLMERLDWQGVAMIEFKTDPRDRVPKLMEINPRFWGSMELAAVSGINFPYLLFLLSQGEPISQPAYRTGVRCRWLIPGDIAHFIANPKRFKIKPSFFSFFDKDTYYDDFHPQDLTGNLAVVACGVLGLFDPDYWRLGVLRGV